MNINQKISTKVFLVIACLALAGIVTYLEIFNKPVILRDVSTGKPVSRAEVKLHSDTGIRCITAPCPSSRVVWTGVTGASGFIFIPIWKVKNKKSSFITVQGYGAPAARVPTDWFKHTVFIRR